MAMKKIICLLLLINLTFLGGCERICGCVQPPEPTLGWTGKWVLVNPKTDYSFTLIIEPKIGEGVPVSNEFRLSHPSISMVPRQTANRMAVLSLVPLAAPNAEAPPKP
jgi:hypothetical protein